MIRARPIVEPDVDDERNRIAWNLPRRPHAAGARATRASSTVEQDLDWQGFLARYVPGHRRHHLPALVAYGAYRSARALGNAVGHAEASGVARQVSPSSTATELWEDEGGAALPESPRWDDPRRPEPLATRRSERREGGTT